MTMYSSLSYMPMLPLALITALTFVVVVTQLRGAMREEQQSKLTYVQTVCDYARVTSNFSQCYAVQNETHTEYLCNGETTRCFVEAH